MSDLAVAPWSRYGKKRLYVKTADGTEVGDIDLVTGAIVSTADGFVDELAAIAREHLGNPAEAPAIDEPPPAVWRHRPSTPQNSSQRAMALSWNAASTSRPTLQAPPHDLSATRSTPRHRVRNLVARVLGVKTERSWRVGAKGEEKVGKELTKLPDGWHVLHAVQVNDADTDIDHVVIGPAGVFSLNTKRHPDDKVTVYERALYVNGVKVDYLHKSRGEARRASRLLTDACGFPVPVRSAIVFVDLADIKEKGRPDEVLIATRRRLVNLLQSLPVSLSPDEVRTIQQQACSSQTWLPAPPRSSTSG